MDPLSALSIAATAAQFIDLGVRIVKRLAEYNTASTKDAPRSLQSINTRLPLLLNSLGRIKSNTEIEKLDVDTKCVLRGVISGCSTILNKIEDVLHRISKQPGESFAGKLKKAFASFKADEIITSLDQDLQMYIHILVLHHVVDRSEWSKTRISQGSGNFVVKVMLAERGQRDKRDKLLKKLYSAASGISLVNEPIYLVLHGPEAVGKTQLALQYTHDAYAAKHYSNVFWLDATSPNVLLLGLQNIAEILCDSKLGDETGKLQLVKEFLESSVNPWLLILDNCHQDCLSSDLLPTKGKGSILLTARQPLPIDGLTVRVPKFLTAVQHKEMHMKIRRAIFDHRLDSLKKILLTDFDINIKFNPEGRSWETDYQNLSIVDVAANEGFVDGMFELLEHGASPELNTEGLPRHDRFTSGVVEKIARKGTISTMTAYLDWEDRTKYRGRPDYYGYALLHVFAEGNIEMASILVDRRDLSFESRVTRDAIVYAAANGHLDALQWVKSAGKLPKGNVLTKALCNAIDQSHLPVIEFLVDSGAPLNEYDSDGKTPLIAAVKKSSPSTESFYNNVIVYLLSKGADADYIHEGWKKTALAEAAVDGKISVVKLLLLHGANPSIQGTSSGKNALELASPDAYPLLTSLDCHLYQDYYVRGLFCAARNDDRDLLLAIWDKVEDKNVYDNDGYTALMIAVRRDSISIPLLMLRKGVNFNVRDKDQMSAWLLACKKGMHQLVKAMVVNDHCSLEEHDSKGNTALMLATRENEEGSHDKTIEILLKAGADEQAVNDYGETAQDIAETKEPKQTSRTTAQSYLDSYMACPDPSMHTAGRFAYAGRGAGLSAADRLRMQN